jgi:HSP90 family molecular chaperone
MAGSEGNPDESTVGMFGVGFYSVFSLSEEPIITSGQRYTVFTWKGNQLTTFAAELPPAQRNPLTAKETSE